MSNCSQLEEDLKLAQASVSSCMAKIDSGKKDSKGRTIWDPIYRGSDEIECIRKASEKRNAAIAKLTAANCSSGGKKKSKRRQSRKNKKSRRKSSKSRRRR
jgi:hypothetical protein